MFVMDKFEGQVAIGGAQYAVRYADGQLRFEVRPEHAALICERLGQPSVAVAIVDDMEREAIQNEAAATDADVEAASPTETRVTPKSLVYEQVEQVSKEEPAEAVADPPAEEMSDPPETDGLTEWDMKLISKYEEGGLRTGGVLNALCEDKKTATDLVAHAKRLEAHIKVIPKFFGLEDWQERLKKRCVAHDIEYDL